MKVEHRHFALILYFASFLCLLTIVFVLSSSELLSSGSIMNDYNIILGKTETVIDYCRDGTSIYSLINKNGASKKGDFFVVFRQKDDGNWERIYENDFTTRNPWKIETADVDGDGEKEILTTVKKATEFDPIEKNRMFIFNFDGEKLYKKWTGSQIAGIWKDFIAGDLVSAPGDELIFIEQLPEDKDIISVYSWFDFGFFLLGSSEGYDNIREVSILGENRIQITYGKEQRKETKTLMMSDGILIEANQEN